jgi:hypothetical protein
MCREEARGGVGVLRLALGFLLFLILIPAIGQAQNTIASNSVPEGLSVSDWSDIQQIYLKASNTDAVDYFGRSVAVSGDTVVVGASSEDSSTTGVNGNQSDHSGGEGFLAGFRRTQPIGGWQPGGIHGRFGPIRGAIANLLRVDSAGGEAAFAEDRYGNCGGFGADARQCLGHARTAAPLPKRWPRSVAVNFDSVRVNESFGSRDTRGRAKTRPLPTASRYVARA